jgi:hypothetical protein
MYREHNSGVILPQYSLIPAFNSSRFFGLTLSRKKVFIEPQTISIGFKSGLSAGLFHQLMLLALK